MNSRLLLSTISLFLMPSLWAYDFEVDGIYYNITSPSLLQVEVTSSTSTFGGYSGNVEIPDYVVYGNKTFTVTGIGNGAFRHDEDLISITFPSHLEKVSSFAFYNCRGLTSLSFPSTIKIIEEEAFRSCSGISKIDISNLSEWCNVDIDEEAMPFSGCDLYINGLEATSIDIPGGILSISDFCFYRFNNITSITIPNSVTKLGVGCFKGTNINSITIPGSISELPSEVFSKCRNLKNIQLPSSITAIGDRAFEYCAIEEINLPNTIGKIESQAFGHCYSLSSIVLPPNLEIIPQWCFYCCSSLSYIYIPSNIKSIGNDAFDYCTSLKDIEIEDLSSFYQIQLPSSGPFYYSENLYINGEIVQDVVIPSDIPVVNKALSWCKSIRTIKFPHSVEEVKSGAFENSENIEQVISLSDTPPLMANDAFPNLGFINAKLFVPEDYYNKYNSAIGWSNFYTKELVPSSLYVTGSLDFNTQDYYATFYNSLCAYKISPGTVAYIGSLVGNSLQVLSLTETIPAGTPVILKSNNANIELVLNYTDVSNPIINALCGTDVDKPTPTDCNIFVLGNDESNGIGFYRYTGATLAANKAFLAVDSLGYATTRSISFSSDVTTSLVNKMKINSQNNIYFNLHGNRLDNPQDGLNIVGGNKVFISK